MSRKSPLLPFDLEYFYSRSTPDPASGCWLWKGASQSNGYGAFRHEGKTKRAHRFVYQIINGELPPHMEVCHKCDVRICVNPNHLFAGTRSDNMIDCSRKGRIVIPNLRGDDSPNSKFNSTQVLSIRSAHAEGQSQRSIARSYGVDKGTIACIIKRKTWKHL